MGKRKKENLRNQGQVEDDIPCPRTPDRNEENSNCLLPELEKKKSWKPSTGNSFVTIKKEETAPQITCPICQNDIDPFVSIATPDSCPDHIFCVDCLLTWTKKSGVLCPIDRKNYKQVEIYESNYYKNLYKSKAVPTKVLIVDKSGKKKDKPKVGKFYIASQGYLSDNDSEVSENDESGAAGVDAAHARAEEIAWQNVFCLVCHDNDKEEELLLCDNCDDCYHIFCLSPPLNSVPPEDVDWFCQKCLDEDLDEVRREIGENRTDNYGRTRSATRNSSRQTVPASSTLDSRDASLETQDVVINSIIDQVMTRISLDRPGRRSTRATNAASTLATTSRSPATGQRGRPRSSGRRRRRTRRRRRGRGRPRASSTRRTTSAQENQPENSDQQTKSAEKPSKYFIEKKDKHLDIYGGQTEDLLGITLSSKDAPKPRLDNKATDRRNIIPPCPFLYTPKRRIEELKAIQKSVKELADDFDIDTLLAAQTQMMKRKTGSVVSQSVADLKRKNIEPKPVKPVTSKENGKSIIKLENQSISSSSKSSKKDSKSSSMYDFLSDKPSASETNTQKPSNKNSSANFSCKPESKKRSIFSSKPVFEEAPKKKSFFNSRF